MVVDIPINCCVRLLQLAPILYYTKFMLAPNHFTSNHAPLLLLLLLLLLLHFCIF